MKTSNGWVRTGGADDAHKHIYTHYEGLIAGDLFPVCVCAK